MFCVHVCVCACALLCVFALAGSHHGCCVLPATDSVEQVSGHQPPACNAGQGQRFAPCFCSLQTVLAEFVPVVAPKKVHQRCSALAGVNSQHATPACACLLRRGEYAFASNTQDDAAVSMAGYPAVFCCMPPTPDTLALHWVSPSDAAAACRNMRHPGRPYLSSSPLYTSPSGIKSA